MEHNTHEIHRVNDMALVAVLRLSGHSVQGMTWSGSTCYWQFRVSPALIELCDRFSMGEVRVEPCEYNRLFGICKREMYENDNNGNRRTR